MTYEVDLYAMTPIDLVMRRLNELGSPIISIDDMAGSDLFDWHWDGITHAARLKVYIPLNHALRVLRFLAETRIP